MAKIYLFVTMVIVLTLIVNADDSDWKSDSWGTNSSKQESKNDIFEKVKIKNRSKKEYDDKIYKYITGDYHVKHNHVELSTIHLNDSLKNDDIEISVHIEDLEVEGNTFKDSIDIKQNPYKNFVNNDEASQNSFQDSNLDTPLQLENSRYNEVKEETSIIEEINASHDEKIKEINIFIEDTNIIVD